MDELVQQTQTNDQHVLESDTTVGNILCSKPTRETDDQATSIVLLSMISPQGVSLIGCSFSLWTLLYSGIILKGYLELFPQPIQLKRKEQYISTDVHYYQLEEEKFLGAYVLGKTQLLI